MEEKVVTVMLLRVNFSDKSPRATFKALGWKCSARKKRATCDSLKLRRANCDEWAQVTGMFPCSSSTRSSSPRHQTC